MSNFIPRDQLSEADVYHLEQRMDRRARNRARGACINDNTRGTHGPATHGVRCERCAIVHRGSSGKKRTS